MCIYSAPIYHDGIFRWWEYSREKFFSYKWSSARITIKNSFFTLKACFRCVQRAMDININNLPQVLYVRLALHNYFELQKEKNPEQSLALALSFVKRVEPATSSLSFITVLKEKKATDILYYLNIVLRINLYFCNSLGF